MVMLLSLIFGGFYQKSLSDGENQGEMGNCGYDEQNKLVIIKLNQLYLLNKLGHKRYFATPERYLMIDFSALTETISHELAHYIQFVKYGKSSCESSGKKDANGEFLAPELVKEHAQFTKEIKQMIVNSAEYEKFKE
ncbi:24918_t:CDS:1 [Entrophospora sp. SA101]|nr:14087_t:CDS:1 [Entrophospora sp. SA101]CAJ0747064.1 24918_t:CDS:1 [Entrophospora sp. SA101]CAJ0830364.1 1839_t:CDS:1 [Entrophospora sp. SA101]CAJ0836322.1 2061_t:CDS:1 [Entrophospora sp. SA101]